MAYALGAFLSHYLISPWLSRPAFCSAARENRVP